MKRCKTFGTKYLRMNQVKFVKGCLPQISLGPFLNTLSRLFVLISKHIYEATGLTTKSTPEI